MKQKAQASLEYLMTYGWALLLIAIIVGALVFIIGDTSNTTFTSSDPTKLLIKGSTIINTIAGIKTQNITGGKIEITNVSLTGGYSTCTLNNTNIYEINQSNTTTITAGEEIFIECTNITDTTGRISINYTNQTGLQKNVKITASGTPAETSNTITLTYPNGGESIYPGNIVILQWTASNWAGNNADIKLSADNGLTWGPICGTVDTPECIDGSCSANWTVEGDCPTGINSLIKITKSDENNVTDTSDETFEIVGFVSIIQ